MHMESMCGLSPQFVSKTHYCITAAVVKHTNLIVNRIVGVGQLVNPLRETQNDIQQVIRTAKDNQSLN